MRKPAYSSGAVDDSILVAVGSYISEGILPEEAGTEKEVEPAEVFAAYMTGKPIIGAHMALLLGLRSQRPDIG